MANLHSLANGVITAVHPNETCRLMRSVGQRNVRGRLEAEYAEPVTVQVNVQPLDAQTLAHLERLGDTKASMQAFIVSPSSRPVMGVERLPVTRTGDMIERADKTWWLVTSVIEDWSRDGWANVGIVRQLEGAAAYA